MAKQIEFTVYVNEEDQDKLTSFLKTLDDSDYDWVDSHDV